MYEEGYDGWCWAIRGPGAKIVVTFRSTVPMGHNWAHWEATEEDLARAENSLMMFGGMMPKCFILEVLPW